jgi:predicted enzyme related to lactoylglutathione lyase
MNRLVHFEIHVGDEEKAMAFYKAVFGWEFQKWPIKGPDGKDEIYWGIITGPKEEPGINGGFVKRRGPAPTEGAAVNAFVCTMTVTDVDESMKKVLAAGGTMAMPKFTIPGVGDMAYCKDVDGNIFGLHRDGMKK